MCYIRILELINFLVINFEKGRKFTENYCRPAGPATPKSCRPDLKDAGPAVNLNNLKFFFLFFNLHL